MTLRRSRTDTGTATAELAVALPSLLLVVAVAVFVLTAVAAHLRCVDVARAAARAAARGEDRSAIRERARSAAEPMTVEVLVQEADGMVRVTVGGRVAPPFPVLGRLLPPVRVKAEAVARVESLS